MTDTVLEFPLKEKMRNYLRVEQLLSLIKKAARDENSQIQFIFFEQIFLLLDLIERLDLRTDIIKDLDVHEKNLVFWSQHPKIDSQALESALTQLIHLRTTLKTCSRFGIELKDDKFLSSIRQRFSIPGGACSFDLPNLHYWQSLPAESRLTDTAKWMRSLRLLDDAIALNLSFVRERGTFFDKTAENGFFQGAAEDKNELIRIRYHSAQNYYPTFSGNKYRYALRFMLFNSDASTATGAEENIEFQLAIC